MAEQQTYNYTLEDIQRYLNGGMNAKQMHEIERAALQDPFLADAIDGYNNADIQQAYNDLNSINASLQADKKEAKVIAMRPTFGWLKVAAVILLIVGAGAISLLQLNKTNSNEKSIAKNEVIVTTQRDSVKTNIIESRPANDSVTKSSTLTADNTLIKKPAYKKETQSMMSQNDTITFNMKATGRHQQVDALEPIASNRRIMAKQAPITVSSRYDSVTAALTGRAQGLAISDSTLKNTEASAITKSNSQDKNDTDIKMRGISSMPDSSYENEMNREMNEVVVTAIGRKKTAKNVFVKDSSSIPVGGWQSFQEYVYKKLNKPYDSTATSNGELRIEFSVDEKGLPYNITILNADDNNKAKDAIDAIKHGPRWVTANKEKKVNITLKY